MRIKDPDPQKRKTFSRGAGNRNYYIAFEGRTEYLYFQGIKNNRSLLNIPEIIDVLLMDRFDQEAGETGADSIIEGILDYKYALMTNNYKTKLFVNTVVQEIYDFYHGDDMEYYERDEFRTKLFYLQKEIVEAIDSDSKLAKDSIIVDEDGSFKICKKMIISEYKDIEGYLKPPSKDFGTYDEEVDCFCLVMDRDYHYTRDKKYYLGLQDKCNDKENPIDLYITNPAFEFWLIMHFDKSKILSQCETDKNKMLKNRKMFEWEYREEDEPEDDMRKPRKRNYAEWYLRDILREEYNARDYSKSKINFDDYYRDIITSAIDNCEKYYTTDIMKLENTLGSNLGLLIKKMIKH